MLANYFLNGKWFYYDDGDGGDEIDDRMVILSVYYYK